MKDHIKRLIFILALLFGILLFFLAWFVMDTFVIRQNHSGYTFIPNLEVLEDSSDLIADRELNLELYSNENSTQIKDTYFIKNTSADAISLPIAYITFWSPLKCTVNGVELELLSEQVVDDIETREDKEEYVIDKEEYVVETKIRDNIYLNAAIEGELEVLDKDKSYYGTICHTTDVTIPAGSNIELMFEYSTTVGELKLIESSDDDLKCNSFTLTCDDPDIIISTNTGLSDDSDTVQLDPDKRDYYIMCKSAKRLQKEAEKNPQMPPVIVTHSGQ